MSAAAYRIARLAKRAVAVGLLAYIATVGIGLGRCLTATPGYEYWWPPAGIEPGCVFSAGDGTLSGAYWRSTCATLVTSRTSPTLIGPGPSNPMGRGLPLDIALWSAAAPSRLEATTRFVADVLDKRLTGLDTINNPIGFVIEEHGAGWPIAAVSRRRVLVYVFPAGGAAPPHGSLSASGETAAWQANWLGIAAGLAMWCCMLAVVLAACTFATGRLRRRSGVAVPCAHCGYERAGIPQGALCPECGKRP